MHPDIFEQRAKKTFRKLLRRGSREWTGDNPEDRNAKTAGRFTNAEEKGPIVGERGWGILEDSYRALPGKFK